MEFKVGQIVELKSMEKQLLVAEIGAKAIVFSLKKMPKYIDVVWINDKAGSQMDGGYYPQGFKVVGYATKKQLKSLYDKKLFDNLTYVEAVANGSEL